MSSFRWFIVPALIAIARNVKSTTQSITSADLSAWATSAHLDFPSGISELALVSLARHGYLRPQGHSRNKRGATNRWFVTARGLKDAQVALQTAPDAAPDMQALSTQLWNLLRIRRHITAVDAAETLIDAEDDFEAQTKRIGALLAAWAKHAPKAVVVAHKREAGRIRYVLEKDLGRWPPPSKSGQMHPSDLQSVCAVPVRYRKAAPRADAIASEGCSEQ